ncbi:MAG TPA: hypothetical protein PKH77_05535 [Anaerolineae bacterium]|nr:hypothetical protein [Anaerolineae bacterium]
MKTNVLRSIVLLSLLVGWVGPLQAAPRSPAPAVLAETTLPASGLQPGALAANAPQSRVIPVPDMVYNTPHVHWLPLTSPDGRHVFIGGEGGPFPLLDLETGAVVAQFPSAIPNGAALRAAFTPDGSGLLINNVLYNALDGTVRRAFNANCATNACAGVAISADGTTALIVPDDANGETLQAWDIATGQLVRTYDMSSYANAAVRYADFSPDGAFIAFNTYGDFHSNVASAWVLDAVTAGRVYTMPVITLDFAFSPDGAYLLHGGKNGNTHLVRTGDWGLERDFGFVGTVDSVAYAPDGQTVAFQNQQVQYTGDPFWGVSVFRVSDGERIALLHGVSLGGQQLAYTQDSRQVLFSLAGYNQSITWRYDIERGALGDPLALGEPLAPGLRGYLGGAALAPDGADMLLYGGTGVDYWPALSNYSSLFLDAATGAFQHLLSSDGFQVRQAVYSPDGAQVLLLGVTPNSGNTARLFNASDGSPGKILLDNCGFQGSACGGMWSGAFSPDGALIAVPDEWGQVFIFDAASGAQLRQFTHTRAARPPDVAFSPDSLLLAVASGAYVLVFDVGTGALLYENTPTWRYTFDLDFSPDGSQLAYGSADGGAEDTLYILNTADWSLRREQHTLHGGGIFSVQYSADGALLLTGGKDGRAKVWDAETGDLRFTTAGSAASAVTWARFDPTGAFIYTASALDAGTFGYDLGAYDRLVRRWNVAAAMPTGREPVTPILPDIIYPGNVLANGWADFRLDAAPGVGLVITATAATPTLSLYARWGAQPTQGLADFRAIAPTTRGDAVLLIPQSQADALYIGVYGTEAADFTLRASYHARYLADVTPRQVGNAGDATLTLHGLGFGPGMAVGLCQGGVERIAAAAVTVTSPQVASARFPLAGATTGGYDLCATWGGATHTLAGAVTVAPGGGPDLQVDFAAPGQHRPNRPYITQLTYTNAGDSNLAAPLLILSNDRGALAQTPCDAVWQDGPVQLFGAASFGPAGVLAPGATGQIPLHYLGTDDPAHTFVNFTVEALLPNAETIPWNDYRAAMRPPAISEADWNTLFPTLTAQLGATWADYLNTLGDNATRLAARGQPAVCVPELLALEVDRAQGLPTAAIAGRVVDSQTGQPVRGVPITAYFHDAADVMTFRAGETGLLDGRFALDGLPARAYRLAVEGYTLTPMGTVTITNDADMSGLLLRASPVVTTPEIPSTPRAIPSFAPSLALDDAGRATLAWQQGDEGVIVGQYDPTSDAWVNVAALPGVSGDAPALAYGPTIANGAPGFALAWRQGYGQEGMLHYAIAARGPSDRLLWGAPITLTQDAYGDTAPSLVTLPDGNLLATYLQRDWSVDDDFDLYYEEIAPPVLVFTLADETGARYELRVPANRLGDTTGCAAVDLKKETDLPKWVPIIGGKYKFETTGEGCITTGCAPGAEVTGQIKVKFTDYVEGAGSIGGSISWQTDKKTCTYVFDKASVTLGVGATGKIPAAIFTVLGVKIEAGAKLLGNLNGSAGWKGGSPARLPDESEVTLTAGLGPYGKAEIWGAEAEIGGTGEAGLKYSMPSNEFEFTGFCLRVNGEVKYRIVSLSFSKAVGNSCSGLQQMVAQATAPNGPQQRAGCVPAVRDGIPMLDCKTERVQAQQGTGNRYPGQPVLADLSADLTHDGPAGLVSTAAAPGLRASVQTASETLAVWTKDSPNPTSTVGSSVVVAAYAGGAWSAPVEIADSTHFNNAPAMAYLTATQPIVVWEQAGGGGISLSSTITAVIDALETTDLYYSVRTGGVWSAPAALAAPAGSDLAPQVAADGQSSAFVAWMNTTDAANTTLYTAFWNGSGWAAPTTLAHPAGIVDSLVAGYLVSGTASIPLLVWAQTTDADDATRDDTRLFYSRYVSAEWSAPRLVVADSVPVPEPAATVARPARGVSATPAVCAMTDTAALLGWPRPPASCCEELGNDTPTPPQPPPDDPATPGVQGSQPVSGGATELIRPNDPNEKVGLTGVGDQHQVLPGTRLAYSIFFENVITATAPAQQVVITDALDANLDWSSLRYESVGFGDEVIAVGSDAARFSVLHPIADYRPDVEHTWWVTVEGARDPTTGVVTWTFRTLDPETEDFPTDALAGFLPPNDASGRGQGFVSFSIAHQPALAPGTLIRNRATIVFDDEQAIVTNEYVNLVDDFHWCNPPAAVEITGALTAALSLPAVFTATVQPLTSTAILPMNFPLTYTWAATGLPAQTRVISERVDTATFTWPEGGAQTVTVTVHGPCGDAVNATHAIVVSDGWRIYLPLVLRTAP